MNDCSLIIQLGDFGFFPDKKWSQDFLDHISTLAVTRNIEVWWLDGNHEDHDKISLMTKGRNDSRFLTSIEDHAWGGLYYLPRGYKFQLDGVSFMSYGGAYSIDRWSRVKYKTWFPQEVIDPADIETIPKEHVDVLLSHDAIYGYDFPYDENLPESIWSAEQRRHLLQLAYKTTPHMAFCGHHHMRATYGVHHAIGKTECHIMNMNGFPDQSWYVFDTNKFKKFYHAPIA